MGAARSSKGLDKREQVAAAFKSEFGRAPDGIARAPGRVNLLGEHVDYNDGFVLPAAIDRTTYVAFSAAQGDECTLSAVDYGGRTRFSLRRLEDKRELDGEAMPQWARYPAGVAWSLLGRGLEAKGMNAAYASDVPQGAGLSSSASVELAFAVAWQAIGGWSEAPMQLALLCQKAENEYVGVKCGIMDQAASACGAEGRLVLLDCRSLEYELLPLPPRCAIIIADTGVRHTLTSSAYNDRRASCEAAVRILRNDLPDITALRDVSVDEFNRLAGKLPREVEMRARHVVEEIQRTREAVGWLRSGNVREFGALMNACHASLRDLYEVSCPELDVMAKIAQSLPGCYGARLTGAGFGGCTVNLVATEEAERFVEALRKGYATSTGRDPEIYTCAASAGAGIEFFS